MNNELSVRALAFASQVPVMALNDTIRYLDVTVCIRGKMEYFIDGTHYVLTEGDCLYMAPGAHRIRISSPELASYVSVNLFGEPEQPLPSTFFPQYLSSQIMQVLELLRTAYTTHNDQKVLLLCEYLIYDLLETYKSRQENPVVFKIKSYILQNIYNKITVDDAISQVFLSKEYCQTLFKQETGMSIVTFINSEKIKLSKTLLADEHKLTTVAQMLGFDDYNYFSRVFRKYTGISPLKYRRILQENN